MADDLVVRDIPWNAERAKSYAMRICSRLDAYSQMEINLARAYLERDAQLAEATRVAEDFEARWMNADEVAKEVLGKLAATQASWSELNQHHQEAVRKMQQLSAQLAAMTLQRDELTRSYDNLLTQWADVLAQLAAMTAERDRLDGVIGVAMPRIRELLAQLTASEAARERLFNLLGDARSGYISGSGPDEAWDKRKQEALAEPGKAGES